MPDIRLIALDLDGTVFDDEKRISARTLQAIHAALDRGVDVVPATGRQAGGIPAEFLQMPGVRYALTANGASVVELASGRSVVRLPFDDVLAQQVLAAVQPFGGVIGVFAIIIHKELLIPILCGVFLVESLSVILQRVYYVTGKRKGMKRRLFKRTPIHDHFRTSMSQIEKGCKVVITKPDTLFHESKITVRFWIVTIVLAAVTIITLKIR